MGSSIKTWVIVLICCGLVQVAASQSLSPEPPARVERSSFGLQVGLIALFVNHELRLANQVTLRTELGLHTRFYLSRAGGFMGFDLSVIVEPRGYYNLTKRQEEGKDITGNSGNFVALRIHYAHAIVLIDDGPNIISIAPMWGIRRNLGTRFNYEAAAGLGWVKNIQPLKNGNSTLPDGSTYSRVNNLSTYLHFRIGYRF